MSLIFDPIQLDLSVTKRESAWVQVCPECQWERVVTYAQAHNLFKGKSSKLCKPCMRSTGEYAINIEGLFKGRVFWPRKSSYKGNKYTKYNNEFGIVSEAALLKQRNAKLGLRASATNNWKGGRVNPRQAAMATDAYKQLRRVVFSRDMYTCVLCKVVGGRLEMDHIKEWRNYPELRYDAGNCRTVCRDCHVKTDNYGAKSIKLGREVKDAVHI